MDVLMASIVVPLVAILQSSVLILVHQSVVRMHAIHLLVVPDDHVHSEDLLEFRTFVCISQWDDLTSVAIARTRLS